METKFQDCPAQTGTGSANPYRWVICALLFFATSINYMDRQILALLKPILDQQLHWSNEQYGMVNSAFQGAYALSLLGFGWLVDRLGAKVGYSISIALWSIAALSHTLAASFVGFLNARIFLGFGEAGNFPSAIKAVAAWFPKKERAFATSLFNSGSNVGAIIAPVVVPALAFAWGWRSAFIAVGIAGFVWLAFWAFLYRKPGQVLADSQVAESAGGGDEPRISWGRLFKYRQTWSFIIAKFLTDPIWWFFLIWMPDYFKKTRHLDLKSSWVYLVTIYAIVTVLSIVGGWVTGYLAGRGWNVTRARKTGMFFFALCVLPIFFATRCGDWTAVLLIGLAGAAHQAWSANLYTTVSDMFPQGAVASVIGIGSMAGSIGGMLLPIYTGKLLDQFQAAGNITGGYQAIFAICAVAYLIAFVVNHLLSPRYEPFLGSRK